MIAASPLLPGSMKAAVADTARAYKGPRVPIQQLNLIDAQKSQIY